MRKWIIAANLLIGVLFIGAANAHAHHEGLKPSKLREWAALKEATHTRLDVENRHVEGPELTRALHGERMALYDVLDHVMLEFKQMSQREHEAALAAVTTKPCANTSAILPPSLVTGPPPAAPRVPMPFVPYTPPDFKSPCTFQKIQNPTGDHVINCLVCPDQPMQCN